MCWILLLTGSYAAYYRYLRYNRYIRYIRYICGKYVMCLGFPLLHNQKPDSLLASVTLIKIKSIIEMGVSTSTENFITSFTNFDHQSLSAELNTV